MTETKKKATRQREGKATRQRGKRQTPLGPSLGRGDGTQEVSPVAPVECAKTGTIPEGLNDPAFLVYPPGSLRVTEVAEWQLAESQVRCAARLLAEGFVLGFCVSDEEGIHVVQRLQPACEEPLVWFYGNGDGMFYLAAHRHAVHLAGESNEVRGTDAGMETGPQLSAAEQCILTALQALARGDVCLAEAEAGD